MSALSELSTLKGGKQEGADNKAAYLFLLPWLIGLFVITIGPMLGSLYLSFTDYSLLAPPEWIGGKNYQRMLTDTRLHNSLKVTFFYVLVGTPLQLILALGIAVLLNRGMRGLPFYRSVFYLPSLMGSSVAIAILWRQIFGTTGLVNQMLTALGRWWGPGAPEVLVNPPGWIADPDTALWTIILLHVWTFGSPMIIFLAGLRQIPTMYYEAASVDGASRWTQFWHITMPLLSPIIFFNLVLQIIGAFQSFTQAFIVSGGSGGPSDSTMFYSLYLYQKGFAQFDMGYASAMAWVLLLIVGAFTAINFFASKYWVFYDD